MGVLCRRTVYDTYEAHASVVYPGRGLVVGSCLQERSPQLLHTALRPRLRGFLPSCIVISIVTTPLSVCLALLSGTLALDPLRPVITSTAGISFPVSISGFPILGLANPTVRKGVPSVSLRRPVGPVSNSFSLVRMGAKVSVCLVTSAIIWMRTALTVTLYDTVPEPRRRCCRTLPLRSSCLCMLLRRFMLP